MKFLNSKLRSFNLYFNSKKKLYCFANNNILNIIDLNAKIKSTKKKIINNLNLTINQGELHVLMGSNGSGKSTLTKIIVGHPGYEIIDGCIYYKNIKINNVEPNIRSLNGIFLCFQNPVEIQGIKNIDFLRKINNSRKKYFSETPMDPLDFYYFITEKINIVGLDISFLSRNINDGFSGGEKKRNELLQLITIDANLCIFDEIDSGLDIDSIKKLVDIINQLKKNSVGLLVISHYKNFIDLLHPDKIHIMKEGSIIETGDSTLVNKIEREGFSYNASVKKNN
ncbi:putative chloroplast protein Ycf16 (nucleomorph) [Lotharella oceanica]|uniref:Putative chloroplast protein Ycf16 n=1 Tax=Lotharella oceanica TaxID=641309 RepID=A0A060D6Q0_9EUKA|nr:putative chloroplast protein Ycf16 [Lotharella oceanica]